MGYTLNPSVTVYRGAKFRILTYAALKKTYQAAPKWNPEALYVHGSRGINLVFNEKFCTEDFLVIDSCKAIVTSLSCEAGAEQEGPSTHNSDHTVLTVGDEELLLVLSANRPVELEDIFENIFT
eukprot:PhF_6_TR34603/c0_g1_i2/m.50391